MRFEMGNARLRRHLSRSLPPFTTTATFSEGVIETDEKTLTEKSGKAYVRCLVCGKDVMAKFSLAGLCLSYMI